MYGRDPTRLLLVTAVLTIWPLNAERWQKAGPLVKNC
jgi:hypothetical protein